MAVLFEGEAKVMINRHRFMGDGLVITFPEGFTIFLNTGDKYSLQFNHNSPLHEFGLVGSNFESFSAAYIVAMLKIGKMVERNGGYEWAVQDAQP